MRYNLTMVSLFNDGIGNQGTRSKDDERIISTRTAIKRIR